MARNGRKPTMVQKITMEKFGLTYSNWLVIAECGDGLHIINKFTNGIRLIPRSKRNDLDEEEHHNTRI